MSSASMAVTQESKRKASVRCLSASLSLCTVFLRQLLHGQRGQCTFRSFVRRPPVHLLGVNSRCRGSKTHVDAGAAIRLVIGGLIVSLSDPSSPVNPVNSCIFVAACTFLYFICGPVFLFITVLGCVYSFTVEVQRVFSIKKYLHQLVSVDCS